MKRFFDKLQHTWKSVLFDFSEIKNEDLKRRALVLNIILICIFILSLIAGICWISVEILYAKNHNFLTTIEGLGSIILFGAGSLLFIKINKKNYTKLTAIILLTFLLLANFHVTYTWGCDVPQTILTYSLIIIMSGILIDSRASVVFLTLISLFLILIFESQTMQILPISTSWKNTPTTIIDVFMFITVYLIIALISWLSTKEIERSIERYRGSEKEALKLACLLKQQNEQLETTVEEKTKEIRDHQLKQLMALNNWSEYGKIAAGLLHDIKNPLTVISLNLGTLNEAAQKAASMKRPKSHMMLEELVKDSIFACNSVASIIKSSQKQLLSDSGDTKSVFEINTEIKNVLLLFEHKASRQQIAINFKNEGTYYGFGNPSKFSRVVANLIMNSIDAFADIKRKKPLIVVTIKSVDGKVIVEIEDNGIGIKKGIQNKIFQALFTTKNSPERAGIGLYASRDIIKNDFDGDLSFISKYMKGSIFKISLPDKYGSE